MPDAVWLEDVTVLVGRAEPAGYRTWPIVDRVSWRVPAGARAAILGPNGSGKSTLLRVITGYLFPSQGRASTLGEELGHVDVHCLRRRIGLVDPGNPYPFSDEMTALEVVMTGFLGYRTLDFVEIDPAWRAESARTLADVGLAGHGEQRFGQLSTGEQRRALVARALVGKPDLLILDEPTAGLDLLARETLLATVDRAAAARPGLTILLVTHHLEELAPSTSQILLLAEGRAVASGSPEEVLRSDTVSQAFRCPVQIARPDGRWTWSVSPRLWGALLGE